MPESTVQQRIVPGAPPPQVPSKSQRKKRKAKKDDDNNGTDAPQTVAPAENVPEHADAHQDTPVATTTREGSVALEDDLKFSPIVELVVKRLKATSKKITRCHIYASTDPEKLDDDQKRTIKQLPNLEAVQKELAVIKGAIETHEAELAHELAAKRADAERAEKARIQEAVVAAQSTLLAKIGDALNLLRFRTSLANGEINTTSLLMQGEEATAIYSAADALLGQDGDVKQAALAALLLGEGDWEGVSGARLIEIANTALNSSREPTPEPEEQAFPVEEAPVTASVTGPSESEAPAPVGGLPGAIAASNSFRFMQDSELEGPFDEAPAEVPQEVVPESIEAADLNGDVEEAAAPATDAPATIDWAAEEGAEELPSIAGLHAEFGTSGSATPAEQAAPVNGEDPTSTQGAPAQEEDGFTPAGRPHRGDGRGRGRGPFRGDRGGYRGHGERGGHRDHGERGGYRDHGSRGGYRGHGERGGYRGRGGERGRGGGGYRRGDGERRGGGRGRGRGDFGGPRGTSSPAPPTPAPAA
ncbi:hypothetical protein D9756_007751 [Leucocoprinus leucothites]|uniref:Uncharacterized protein n=1 Tax=Leucocoprinus leucothites TaxID=201217 RepID=A0A8H5D189_9AGAR|nr:hypothetical protein D9756_007751 [Leucoagaricus leucothites]